MTSKTSPPVQVALSDWCRLATALHRCPESGVEDLIEQAEMLWNQRTKDGQKIAQLLEALEAVSVRLDEMRTYDFENLDASEAKALQQWADECADLLHQRIAAAPQLLEALEAVEWVSDDNYPEQPPGCPWCGNYRRNGHAPDCLRQAAIAAARGGTDSCPDECGCVLPGQSCAICRRAARDVHGAGDDELPF